MVREVTADESGKLPGVSFCEQEDMKEYKLNPEVVVLGASACESSRIF